IPLITVVALSISSVFSGAILTETVFSYQGVGKLVFDSIIANDFNVAMVSFIISISMVLLMNLVADILYGFADPRISYS
ncbi:MAG TPA: ABC transporter permease subunit, partial [Pseudobdellovibrionaceae bacterium]|nr:ABC transporter permease subunit [Pseudobdellovibrionaceae bacterium]